MLSNSELKDGRARLAKIIKDSGFTDEVTPQTVSKLTEDGFEISGAIGARYRRGEGLTVWNKAQRSSGSQFKVSELVELEKKLAHEMNVIWLGWLS